MKNIISNEKRIKRLKLSCSLLADGKVKYFHQGNEYVDLGLPSGTKWATMNVGATSETDYGLYFQCGDTKGYTAEQVGYAEGEKFFHWQDYKWTEDEGLTFTKYNSTDCKTVLDLEDDAVAANWGGSWRMPTLKQFRELLSATYVTNIWVSDYQGSGVNGRLFKSVENGNTLFIPAAGYAGTDRIYGVGDCGFVWSNSLLRTSVESGSYLRFGSNFVYVNADYRYYGHSVRGVIG